MSPSPTASEAYCSDHARSGDEDRWLASSYAPPALRKALRALCAFRVELRRIPAAVSEPALGEIRLQWWREALAEIREGKPPRAHPVVEGLVPGVLNTPQIESRLHAAIDAAARPLYGEGFSSLEELEYWLSKAHASLDEALVLAADGGEALAKTAAQAGTAFALAREGRLIAPALSDEIFARAQELYREAAPALAAAPSSAAPALLHHALTPLYLRNQGAVFPLRKRLRLFSAMAFARF